MANYNKSFNFRNGVQVDEDNFLVSSTGLVGIGTTIPRTDLDVYGNVSVSGLTTSKNLIVSGIATLSDVRVGSAVTINGSLGIVSAFRFLGDGSYLSNLPTSMWVDYTSGPGITSIYALRNAVGIATTGVTRSLQVGGRTEIGQKGVGITSDGDIYASGIVTAGFFSGSGASITSINASNISSGTLNNSRLPSQINLATGIATIRDIVVSSGATISGINTLNSSGLTTKEVVSIGFTGNKYYVKSSVDLSTGSLLKFESGSGISINGYTGSAGDFLISNGSGEIAWSKDISTSGIATVGVLTTKDIFASGITTTGTIRSQTGIITSLTSINLNSFSGDFSRVYSGLGTFVNSIATNLNVGGIGTVSTLRFTTGIGTNLDVLTFDAYSIDVDEINCGVAATFANIESSYSTLGITTTTSLTSSGIEVASGITTSQKITSGNIRINHTSNTIETTSGDITITPLGKIELNKDIITYFQSYFTGITTVAAGLLPDQALGAYLGSTLKPFEVVYVGDLNLGVGNSNKITTRSQDLILDSATNKVNVQSDLVIDNNLNVSGISTFTDIVNVNAGLLPDQALGAYLGSTLKPFEVVYVGDLNLGVGNSNSINTRSQDLILDSATNKVNVKGDLIVDNNLNVSGISTFTDIVNVNAGLLPDQALGAYLGSTLKPFEVVYVGDLNLGVGNSNKITTRSQDLILDSATQKIIIDDDAIINRNLSVTGGITTVTTLRTSVGIVPSTTSVYLGTSLSPFSELFVENITIGVGTTDVITTKVGELKLDSFNNIVNVQANLVVGSALSVTGQSNFSGIATVETGLLPDIDQGSYLGDADKAFSSAFAGDVRIGYGYSTSITTRTGDLLLIPFTQFTTIQGKLDVDNVEVAASSLLKGDTYFGNSAGVVVDTFNNRVGIGTSLPSRPLQIRNDAGSTPVELWSNTISQIGLGYNTIGAGSSTGNLYYNIANKELGLTNEDIGDLKFVLHSGSSGVGTGNFVWNYGQTDTDLLTLSYNGHLGIGNTDFNYRVYIEGPLGAGRTSLYVNGPTFINGNSQITGIVTFLDPSDDGTNKFVFNTSTGTLTIKNLVVNGTTSGVTASGVGLTVYDDTTNYGALTALNFANGLSVTVGLGTANIGLSTNLNNIEVIGIGTATPKASLDVNENDTGEAPFILPPRIDTTTRDSYTPIAGAFIFNTTVNKHQAYDGSTWRNLY